MPLAFIRSEPVKARVPVGRLPFWIGSDPGADLVLDHPAVLPRHAKVKLMRGEALLSSVDGAPLFVNGLDAPFWNLRGDDVVTVGDDGPRLRYQQRLRLDAARPDAPLATAWMRDSAYPSSRGPYAYGEGEPLGAGDVEKARIVSAADGGAPLVVKLLGAVRGAPDADHHIRLVSALAGAPHPNLAPTIDGGIVRAAGGNRRWLVTQWVEGRTAKERMDAAEPVEVGLGLRVLASLAEGLAHLHARGLVHRDVAPSNVVIQADGTGVLIDPGHAVLKDADRATTPAVVGTPGYVAPEAVLAGGPPPTRAADVYGLAAVGYALLLGRPPAAGADVLDALARSASRPPTPAELGVEVPEGLERLLFDALDADPRRRPEAARFAEALGALA